METLLSQPKKNNIIDMLAKPKNDKRTVTSKANAAKARAAKLAKLSTQNENEKENEKVNEKENEKEDSSDDSSSDDEPTIIIKQTKGKGKIKNKKIDDQPKVQSTLNKEFEELLETNKKLTQLLQEKKCNSDK